MSSVRLTNRSPLSSSSPWKSPNNVSMPTPILNNDMFNTSLSSSSWIYNRNNTPTTTATYNTPSFQTPSPKFTSSPIHNTTTPSRRVNPNFSDIDTIDDKDSLRKYMKDYENYERKNGILNNGNNHSVYVDRPMVTSFWSHPGSNSNKNVSPMTSWRCQYQLASPGSGCEYKSNCKIAKKK